MDGLQASCRAFALQHPGYEIATVLNEAADMLDEYRRSLEAVLRDRGALDHGDYYKTPAEEVAISLLAREARL